MTTTLKDREPAIGVSRGVHERFAADAYDRARHRVRVAAREVFGVDALVAAFERDNGPGSDPAPAARALLATPAEVDVAALLDPAVAPFEWFQVAAGVWNGHAAAWDEAGVRIDAETPSGLFRLAQRFSADQLRSLDVEVGTYLALVGMYEADELLADPTSNIFLNNGTEHIWRRVTGIGSLDVLFDNANARIGVGSGTTAAARTQTDLQGASKTYKAMESGFPTVTAGDASGGAKTTYKSVFGSTDANHDHKEWVVDNKASTGTKVMNRKVQDFGTKASGSTWTYTFELQIS